MNGTYEFSPLPQNETPKREFSLAECLFAWACLIGGYLFVRALPVIDSPVGGFVLILLSFACVTAVMAVKKVKINPLPIIGALSALVVSLALIFSSNAFLHTLSFVYFILVFCYYIYSATGNCIKNGFCDLILMDFIKALLVMPFCSFAELFKAMFSGKAKNSGKTIGKILLGIALALLPTVAVITLLSYDEGFMRLFESVFNFNLKNIFSHVMSFVFGIPVGMYVFGLFISSVDNKKKDSITEENCSYAAKQVRFIPAVTVAAAVLPLLFVYGIFFISQWQYYVSAFTGVLPEGLSYATYAREGFFQLLAVSVINLAVIIAVVLFMKRKEEKPSLLLKLISGIFSAVTLVLITTAFSKLVLYINQYGLTQKRVYAAWFMVVLTVIFIIILIKQLLPKLNAVAFSVAAFVLLFAALSVSNADRLIAKYNVDSYLSGKLTEIDVGHLCELGDAAVPELVRLYSELDMSLPNAENVKKSAKNYIKLLKVTRFAEGKTKFYEKTVPYYIAEAAIEKADTEK